MSPFLLYMVSIILYACDMKKPVNHEMVKIDEVLKVLDDFRVDIKQTYKSSDLIDQIERKILTLETKRRLVVIDGGKNK